MYLRRLVGSTSDLCKITYRQSSPGTSLILKKVFFPISTVVDSSSPGRNVNEDIVEDDFFGIKVDKQETFQPSNNKPSSNEAEEAVLSHDAIRSRHLPHKDASNNVEMEKYIRTKFGQIRFDLQNTAPFKGSDMSSPHMRVRHQNNEDMDYFSEMYFGPSLGETTKISTSTKNNTVVNNNNNSNTVDATDINPEYSSNDYMNAIDSQYFGDLRENVDKYAAARRPDSSKSNSSDLGDTFSQYHAKVDFNNDNNSIESQYFDYGTPNDNNSPQQTMKSDFTNNDNHFVDSQYFDYSTANDNDKKLQQTIKRDLTNHDNFIESQYFDNPTTNDHSLQEVIKSYSNASTNHFDTAEKNDWYFTESYSDSRNSLDNNDKTSPSKSENSQTKQNSEPKPQNAFEALQKIRRENKTKNEGPLVDSKGFRILKDQVNDLSNLTTYEVANHLKSKILFDKNDVIVIDKPYGLPSHGGPGINASIAKALPELAKKIRHSGDIHLIHRLDKETTGVMLLAKTAEMAHTLKDMFRERQVIKTYWALTKGIPNPPRGVIDIPIAEGSVDGKHRMVLQPEYNEQGFAMKKSKVKSHEAITHYRVLNSSYNCALVECKTETGIKHQVRVHLAFGLNTPILGDHKYSHLTKMAPQRLFPEILDRLHIRQSKARHVPVHLHATSVILPEFLNGKNFTFKAPLPYHFRANMKSLKFRRSDLKNT